MQARVSKNGLESISYLVIVVVGGTMLAAQTYQPSELSRARL